MTASSIHNISKSAGATDPFYDRQPFLRLVNKANCCWQCILASLNLNYNGLIYRYLHEIIAASGGNSKSVVMFTHVLAFMFSVSR